MCEKGQLSLFSPTRVDYKQLINITNINITIINITNINMAKININTTNMGYKSFN